jgi:hypothetical protein
MKEHSCDKDRHDTRSRDSGALGDDKGVDRMGGARGGRSAIERP